MKKVNKYDTYKKKIKYLVEYTKNDSDLRLYIDCFVDNYLILKGNIYKVKGYYDRKTNNPVSFKRLYNSLAEEHFIICQIVLINNNYATTITNRSITLEMAFSIIKYHLKDVMINRLLNL